MTEETQNERYTRLADIINSTYEDHVLTADEKREIGDILADNMTPYEFSCDVQEIGDIWYMIDEDYASLTDFDLTLEFIAKDGYENVDDWIHENGLPLPDKNEMIDQVTADIDKEEYINDYFGDVLDMLPDQCEFNLSDDEIVHLFEVYVEEPDEKDVT